MIRIQGLVREYGEKVKTRVLHGLDLEICAGEFVALKGPSGSGKSTLLNLLGLLDRPTSGRIWVQGVEIQDLPEEALTRLRGRTLGFVFQFHHLLPAFTALENVLMPLWAEAGRKESWMEERARHLLEQVGLEDRMSHRATDLSGGQQQRVAIARALAMRPALVLADEPTGNLDQASGRQVFELMRRFNQEEGIAFLIVTHEARIAARCDRLLDMVDGRIVQDCGPP